MIKAIVNEVDDAMQCEEERGSRNGVRVLVLVVIE